MGSQASFWQEGIKQFLHEASDPVAALNEVRSLVGSLSPYRAAPVDYVQWVPVEHVRANNYNPHFPYG